MGFAMIEYLGESDDLKQAVARYNSCVNNYKDKDIRDEFKCAHFYCYEEQLNNIIALAMKESREWFHEYKVKLLEAYELLITTTKEINYTQAFHANTITNVALLRRMLYWGPYLSHQMEEVRDGLIDAIASPIRMVFSPVQTAKGMASAIRHPINTIKAINTLFKQRPVYMTSNFAGGFVVGKMVQGGINYYNQSGKEAGVIATELRKASNILDKTERASDAATIAENAAIADQAAKASELASSIENMNTLAKQVKQATGTLKNAQVTLEAASGSVPIQQVGHKAPLLQATLASSTSKATKVTHLANKAAQAKVGLESLTQQLQKAQAAVETSTQSVRAAEVSVQAATTARITTSLKVTTQAHKVADLTSKSASALQRAQQINDTACLGATATKGANITAQIVSVQKENVFEVEDKHYPARPSQIDASLNEAELNFLAFCQKSEKVGDDENISEPNDKEKLFLNFMLQYKSPIPSNCISNRM